jgi:hypothetical protein
MLRFSSNFAFTSSYDGVRAPVLSGSFAGEVRFNPMPKKHAIRLWHRARKWDRTTRQPGYHGGVIGRVGLAVLHSLIFDFLNFKTGQLDPSYEGIAKKAGVSRASVGRALRRLKALGVLSWVRRCKAELREGRRVFVQGRNAYTFQGEKMWLECSLPPEPLPCPPPAPGTWGDHPPLPDAVTLAIEAQDMGLSRSAVLAALQSDPGDRLAAALANLGHSMAVL